MFAKNLCKSHRKSLVSTVEALKCPFATVVTFSQRRGERQNVLIQVLGSYSKTTYYELMQQNVQKPKSTNVVIAKVITVYEVVCFTTSSIQILSKLVHTIWNLKVLNNNIFSEL